MMMQTTQQEFSFHDSDGISFGPLDISIYSDDDASGKKNNNNNNNNTDNNDTQSLGKLETKAVSGFRILFFSVLVLSMIIIAVLVYWYIQNSEWEQFENQFGEDANKVLSSISASFLLTLGGVDAFVVSLASYAKASNQNWPYVTIPDFAVRAEKVRGLTNAVYMNLYNYVPHDQRYKWEAYSALYGPTWVQESLAIQEREGMYTNIFEEWNITDVTYWDVIHDFDEFEKKKPGLIGLDPSDPGPFLPMWQTSPVIPIEPPYNWDLMSTLANASVLSVLETHKVCLSEAYLIAFENDTETIKENEAEAEWISGYITTGEDPMEPIIDIYYPILPHAMVKHINLHTHHQQHNDTVNEENNNNENAGTTTPTTTTLLGGIFSLSIYWRDFLKDILPEGTNGIFVVVESPCNPTFTYQIDGPLVTFLGTGDFHESKYDHMEVSSPLLSLDQSSGSSSYYTGLPINEDFCSFHLRVFPSSLMEGSYTTSNRVTFTILAISIFLFTAAAFLTYDWWVQRRQRLVMKTAIQSTAIVSDLFPSSVRDRLYPVVGGQHQSNLSNNSTEDITNNNDASSVFNNNNNNNGRTLHFPRNKARSKLLSHFLNTTSTGAEEEKLEDHRHHDDDSNNHYNDNEEEDDIVMKISATPSSTKQQIADHFPEVTVLFGDISNFTSWSNTREPSHVFTLLETLYGAFDRIAKRRRIFKIETIGDCYVAVTGLPEPRKNHAVAMVVFAAECRKAMNTLTKRLQAELGPDTANLMLRIGIHSGAVTAGVLRGEKSRFQLFGDTMNTTARIESTGMPNKIQVSQQTADLLRSSGKDDWITPREDWVEAKGKGKIQTYWVEPKSKPVSFTPSSTTPSG